MQSLLARSFFLLLIAVPSRAADHCGIRLHNLNSNSGKPGDELVLFGEWGHTQGEKVPCINKGNSHRLEVLSWLPSRIRTRIPDDLKPGQYKVGVYCTDLSKGATSSSTWVDFRVLSSNEPATFEEQQWQEASEDILNHHGRNYRAQSYDGETLTVEIDLPTMLPQRIEVNARKEQARLPDGKIGELCSDLLALGANYIDIGYNTRRIAAEFPLKLLDWNSWKEGKTVEILYEIQEYIDSRR